MPAETDTTPPYDSQARRREYFARQEEDRKKLQAIYDAMVGNEGLGNPGLVKRVLAVELTLPTKASAMDVATLTQKVEAHDRKLWFGAAILSGAWAMLVAFKEHIPLFKK